MAAILPLTRNPTRPPAPAGVQFEPEPVAISAKDELTVWEYADGSVVLRVGPDESTADTIHIDAALVGVAWRALKFIDDRSKS